MSTVNARVLGGFDDPRIDAALWQSVLRQGDTDVIFMTWQWLSAWWETIGIGDLVLVAAERDGQIIAIAPLYAREGMLFFVGTGSADYHDFVGDISDSDVLDALLATARAATPDFVGFKFHLVSERSRTGQLLMAAAKRLDLLGMLRKEDVSVAVDLTAQADAIGATLNRSMLKRENYFRQAGPLLIHRETDAAVIKARFAEFRSHYDARWHAKGLPGDLAQPEQVEFYQRFLDRAAQTGWIRYLQIDWQGRFLAAELAWHYRGIHFSAPWCFAIAAARHSPGHVLLRQSLLAALEAGLHTYDLGLGEQEYKFRLPAQRIVCSTWGLYAKDPH